MSAFRSGLYSIACRKPSSADDHEFRVSVDAGLVPDGPAALGGPVGLDLLQQGRAVGVPAEDYIHRARPVVAAGLAFKEGARRLGLLRRRHYSRRDHRHQLVLLAAGGLFARWQDPYPGSEVRRRARRLPVRPPGRGRKRLPAAGREAWRCSPAAPTDHAGDAQLRPAPRHKRSAKKSQPLIPPKLFPIRREPPVSSRPWTCYRPFLHSLDGYELPAGRIAGTGLAQLPRRT